MQEGRQRGDPSRWRIPLTVLSLALVVRLVYLFEASASPRFFTPIVDSAAYHSAARTLAAGGPMGESFFWQAFFYPLFLAGVYAVSGASILAAKVLQVVLGAGVCAGTYLLAKRLFDSRTGAVAGVIAALYGPLIFFDGELLATAWASVWAVVLVGLFMKARACEPERRLDRVSPSICGSISDPMEGDLSAPATGLAGGQAGAPRSRLLAHPHSGVRPELRLFPLLGIVCGLSIITRATFVPFVAAASVWLLVSLRRSGLKRRTVAAGAALLFAGALVVLLPVSALCHRVTGRFSPLPETGALNLYMGNTGDSPQCMAVRPGPEWMELLLLPSRNGAETKAAEERFYLARVADHMTSRPVHFLGGLATKAVHMFSSREVPSNFDPYAMRRHSRLLSVLMWKLGLFGFPFGLLLPLAVLGLVCHARKVPAPVWLFLLLYPAAIILVFVTARYRAPVIPVLCALAAAGLWRVVDLARGGHWRRLGGVCACAVALSILCSLAGPFPAERVDYEAELCFSLGSEHQQAGRSEEAVAWYRRGLERDPGFSEAYNSLGLIAVEGGRFDEAAELYQKAIDLAPGHFWYHQNLGAALLQAGKVTKGIPHYVRAIELSPHGTEEDMFKLPRGFESAVHR